VAAAGGTQTRFSDQAASAGTRKTAIPGLVLVAAAVRAKPDEQARRRGVGDELLRAVDHRS
jgi:hypothetical protein